MQTISQTDKFMFAREQIESFVNFSEESRSEIFIESFEPLLEQMTTAEWKPQNFNFITVKLMMKFRFDLFIKNLWKIEYEIFLSNRLSSHSECRLVRFERGEVMPLNLRFLTPVPVIIL